MRIWISCFVGLLVGGIIYVLVVCRGLMIWFHVIVVRGDLVALVWRVLVWGC